MRLITKIRAAWGNFQGYGHCYRCGRTWDMVRCDNSTMWYRKGSGMAPLCDQCFVDSTPIEIEGYIDKLLVNWRACGGADYHGQSYDDIAHNAKQSMRRIKASKEVK